MFVTESVFVIMGLGGSKEVNVGQVCKNGNHNNIDETDSYMMLHVDNF